MSDEFSTRLRGIILCFSGLSLLLIGRLTWFHLADKSRHLNPTGVIYERSISVPARKGDILDRHQEPLATCLERCSVAADPQRIVDPLSVARILSPRLHLPVGTLCSRLTDRFKPVVLRAGVPESVVRQLQAVFPEDLLEFVETTPPSAFAVYAYPPDLQAPARVSQQLALLLGLPPEPLFRQLSRKDLVKLCVADAVDRPTADKIQLARLDGIAVHQGHVPPKKVALFHPTPDTVHWVTEENQEGHLKRRPVLRSDVWQALQPLWEGHPPTRQSLEAQMRRVFVYLRRDVPSEIGDQIESLHLEGIQVLSEPTRVYTYQSLARELLGRVDIDEHGLSGLEKAYDLILSGTDGYQKAFIGPSGQMWPHLVTERKAPVDGKDLVLTLDLQIQHFVEEALKKALHEKQGRWGTAIVVDPSNGEILALANATGPTAPQGLPNRNWALIQPYEPGSVLKPLVVCAALEEKMASPQTVFHCPGVFHVGGTPIRCLLRAHGRETVSEAVRDSCNVTLLQLGLRLQQERLEKWFRRFGLFERTALSDPDQEATGNVFALGVEAQGRPAFVGLGPRQGAWSQQKIATVSFGQGILVTAIGLVRAYCAIVNGGTLPSLHLIQRIQDGQGRTVVEFPADQGTPILSAQTSEEVRAMMRRVVWEDGGTGRPARSPLYETAGKTGTSLGYRKGDWRMVSFLGFAPFSHPRVLCYVLMADPQVGGRTGSSACAPAFREIVEQTLQYLGVPPETERLAARAGTRGTPSGEEAYRP